ncbi:MAG: molybdopterin biosynthesis protein [Deltaproteobacteria bacterium]|nr:molybdopterin biosynthesis protein [Deltaproteobacteria bacterium]
MAPSAASSERPGHPVKQAQFLTTLDRDEAERIWRASIATAPVGSETVELAEALGRVLAEDVRAVPDVPGFDRSNMDGFAVRAEDTFGATEATPARLSLNSETIPTGIEPQQEVKPGTATTIATGGMLPRGADAVVPVEHTDLEDDGRTVVVRNACVPGQALSFAGTDVGSGETVLFAGTPLTSRETGVLAAIGCERVTVHKRPVVAILSTGDEIVQPGEAMRPGLVFDSNGRILADAVRELGGTPWFLGAFRDDEDTLRQAVHEAIAKADLVLLSGGTSKGEGDLCARVVEGLDPGIQVHGVALKPGKPICLAAHGSKPVVILPGFPTSAVFTFHEFVAPVVRELAGFPPERRESVAAHLALPVQSDRGRLEYLLVGLVRRPDGQLAAWPMGKGSGSVTSFSRADGFVRIPRNVEQVEADAPVEVTLVGHELAVADLVVIGSHCAGLDRIASALAREGLRVKLLAVGSQGGLAAAERGECDVAPMHLLDPETGRYNEPFLGVGLRLLRGYRRMQGIVTRPGEEDDPDTLVADPNRRMVNRNRGSGTRVLIDQILGERRPPGFAFEPRSHYAVAAAVAQGRADWGVTIETVAKQSGLGFRPLAAEHYDFVIPADRWDRPAVAALRRLLEAGTPLRRELAALGFSPPGPAEPEEPCVDS